MGQKLTHIPVLLGLLLNILAPLPVRAGEAVVPRMPQPGTMVNLSPSYTPANLKGITIHPDNALQFDFLVHKGEGNLSGSQKTREYAKLVKYFLASLTIADKDQWVNLSPYEKDRIIEDNFGKTEMGRDLLAQDYLLKQITSSLMYPESGLGKSFWDKVYARAYQEYGHTNIPVNTFNKVWIVPDEAVVYESGNTAYILKSHLKVMLEEDYLALSKNTQRAPQRNPSTTTRQVIRDVILPELEREVNEGKNFAPLRQIVSSMVLATWYKKALKESLLGKIYADKDKTAGIVSLRGSDPKGPFHGAPEAIYQKYLQAFKKGVYNFIKEETDIHTQQTIPRKYFAGGIFNPGRVTIVDKGSISPAQRDAAQLMSRNDAGKIDRAAIALGEAAGESFDRALTSMEPEKVEEFKRRFEAARSLSEMSVVVRALDRYVMDNGLMDAFRAGQLDQDFLSFAAILSKKNYALGKMDIVLHSILRGRTRTYRNENGTLDFYFLRRRTGDEKADVYMSLDKGSEPYTFIYTDNVSGLIKVSESVRTGVFRLRPGAQIPERYRQILSSLPDIRTQLVRSAIFGKNSAGIQSDAESSVMSISFEFHRIRQERERNQSSPNDNRRRRLGLAFALFNEDNPGFHLSYMLGEMTAQLQDGNPWTLEFLGELSNNTRISGVLDWLRNLLAFQGGPVQIREQINAEIREKARQYYIRLTGMEPVKNNGFEPYVEPRQRTSHVQSSPSSPMAGPSTAVPERVISVIELPPPDRFAAVKTAIKGLFEQPQEINPLIAGIKGSRSQDPYRDALQAMAEKVSAGGVSIYTLMQPGPTGVTNMEEQISEVMPQVDRLKNTWKNPIFKNYFDAIPAVRQPRAIVSSEAGPVSATASVSEEAAVQEAPTRAGPSELLVLNNSPHIDNSRDIREAKQQVGRIYNIIKRVERGEMPVTSLRPYMQINHRGIFRGRIRDHWVVYFRYFQNEDRVLIISFENIDVGHRKARQLETDFVNHLSNYSVDGIAELGAIPENQIERVPDNAMASDVGGIDLNSANLNLQIKRDGRGVPLPLARQDMAQLSRIPGLVPRILEIKPAGVLPVFAELAPKP